jgi:hypothetical protein
VGVDAVDAAAIGHAHQRRGVAHEGEGRQSALADDDRVDELDRDVLGVGGRRAVAEHEQAPAAQEARCHVATGEGQGGGVVGEREHRRLTAKERAGDKGFQRRGDDGHGRLIRSRDPCLRDATPDRPSVGRFQRRRLGGRRLLRCRCRPWQMSRKGRAETGSRR